MSSLLPQYNTRRVSDEEEQRPLNSWKDDDRAMSSPPPPSYPPGRDHASGSGSKNKTITYTFVPRWPVKGKTESVLGLAGGKDATLEMVLRAFPVLNNYPPGRIEFLAAVSPETKLEDVHGWSRIMDEAWDEFTTDAPSRLKIQVADLPGQARRREIRTCAFITLAACSPFAVFALFILIIYLNVGSP
ncbi:hypothetical protein BD324DRAFT_623908 [Kockovaella imperatae]|uniref:Uncharacterized protein n=1 Tax=Kockovaella imperatae TaxID=4999 RepID=A0A1Y1ULE8_9TREE|nr:hypothetical protein BD324DRAFT_623908 [Kockovaella imperatae]ORX37945.1 hypothetical protein BD324DRAFT_623908 [Kockovaella imperatae]